MARGNEIKEQVIKKIIDCFGADKAFVYDKKIYINGKENGEDIQVCLSLTCPKMMISPNGGETVPVEPPKSAFSSGFDFESMGVATPTAPEPFKPAEITNSERELVQDLMRRLGL